MPTLEAVDTFALTTTVKSYSPGTRVDLLNYTKANTAFVSVIATKEVLEVSQDDIVKLRSRTTIVDIETQTKNRQQKALRRLTRMSQQVEGGYR